MVFKIEFSDNARLDLRETRNYYSAISKKLLRRFDDSILESVTRLETNPDNFQKPCRNIKIIFTKIFPYGIHYVLEDDTVFIQRILHQKQYYN